MSYFFTITQLRVGFMILSSITNYGNLNHLNTNMVVNGNEWYWVTSTIMTVWTGLYTWHYIISIFFCFFFWCFVSRKGKWHDKWPCCFKITVEWFGCCDWTIEVSVTTKMYLSVLSATAWLLGTKKWCWSFVRDLSLLTGLDQGCC